MTTLHAAALRQAGEALYGPQWQSPLARALGVSGRTMRRWAKTGSTKPGIDKAISALVKERSDVLNDMLSRGSGA